MGIPSHIANIGTMIVVGLRLLVSLRHAIPNAGLETPILCFPEEGLLCCDYTK